MSTQKQKSNAPSLIAWHVGQPNGAVRSRSIDHAQARKALALVEVRLLDHIVVAGDSFVSLAERGLI